MRDAERMTVPVECRASEDGPTLYMLALTEGRAARGGLAEVWAPGSACWPADGIEVRTEHRAQGGPGEARAVPTRAGNEIRVEVRATDKLRRAVDGGKKYASVEFHSLAEVRTASGVREIERALLVGVTVTSSPIYQQTSAEVRTAQDVTLWL